MSAAYAVSFAALPEKKSLSGRGQTTDGDRVIQVSREDHHSPASQYRASAFARLSAWTLYQD